MNMKFFFSFKVCFHIVLLIYSDIKGVPFRMELETELTPSDESLKQGRNRSWLLY